MKSDKAIKFFVKSGLLPAAAQTDGQATMDLCNKMFLVLNVARILPLSGYLYFSVNHLMEEFSPKTSASFLIRSIPFLSGPVLGACLADTARRLGVYSFNGTSQLSGIKILVCILIPLLYGIGFTIMEIPEGRHLNTYLEKVLFSLALACLNLYRIIDYAVLYASNFLWVNDLRVKIVAVLTKKNVVIEDMEDIWLHYITLSYAFELLALITFSYSQFFAILAVYLGVSGDTYYVASLIPALLVALSLLTSINVVEELYRLMNQLMEKIKIEGLQQASLREMSRFKNTADKFRSAGPLTGMGFFTVEKNTLSAMLSITITYIIILLQST